MDKIEITKKIAKVVVGSSVSFAVAQTIKNNVIADKPLQKVEIFIGSAVIGYMAAEKAEAWTDHKIDDIIKWWKEIVTSD